MATVLDGRYQLVKPLGVGGFGRTFLARDTRRPGAPTCVVKQLKPASDDPEFIREARRLFNTEAETLEKLGRHDRIPQLLAYFEEKGHFFLVQEFIEGHSLDRELQSDGAATHVQGDASEAPTALTAATPVPKKVTEAQAVAILKDVLEILEFVHREGVIHRDIKPENLIRRQSDGRLVLIDFGAVKALGEASAVTNPESTGESRYTVTIGTPGYMPTEQCAGRPNYTSDLYALGMVVIRALTGCEPTELPHDPDTGELVWRDRAKVSSGLAMVLSRMVRSQYAQRYQSAKEVMQALNAFVVPVEAAATPTVTSATAPRRLKTVAKPQTQGNAGVAWLIFGLGGAGFLVLVAAGLSPLFLALEQSPKPTPVSPPPGTPVPAQTTAVTPPPPPATGAPPADVADPTSEDIRNLVLAAGTPFEVGEQELTGAPHRYRFPGTAGANLVAQINGTNAKFTLTGSDGQLVQPNTVDLISWSGTLPKNDTYELTVVGTGRYKLTLGMSIAPAPVELPPPPEPQRTIQIR
ncbi:MAG: protein kinase domain-containing protein [Pseudanabaenaceae cyanobacterium]